MESGGTRTFPRRPRYAHDPRPLPPMNAVSSPIPPLCIDYPAWVDSVVDWDRAYATDEERMRLAIGLSRENVERETGGPFGAAIFESESGRLVSVGMNSVVRLNNCTLHGEVM